MVATKFIKVLVICIMAYAANVEARESSTCAFFIESHCGDCDQLTTQMGKRECLQECISDNNGDQRCLQARLRLGKNEEKAQKKQKNQKCNAFITLNCECPDLMGAENKSCIAECIEGKDSDDICETRVARMENQAERQANRELNQKCNAYIKLNSECSGLRGAERTICISTCAESRDFCAAKLQRMEKRSAKKVAKAATELANKKCNAFITLSCECTGKKGADKKDCISACIADQEMCEAKVQRILKRANWVAKKMENKKCNAFIKLNCDCTDTTKGVERVECLSKCIEGEDSDDHCKSRTERWNLRAENKMCKVFIKDNCECDEHTGDDKRACVSECINEEDSDDVCAKMIACQEFVVSNCEDCLALENGTGKQKCKKQCIMEEDTDNMCEFQQMKYGQQMFSKWNMKQNEKKQEKKQQRQAKKEQRQAETQAKKEETKI
ncbi:hypothetical protein SARC_04344 [Sphaeroforma arctica JP610]|uniref:Uncharacterized protein n=1 Tax=Sphaeroforma arctica JP610 TaxID=667725 RepID=A0A0L0G564_9EUKA|nr:hypothetical protein SARC_04344 [Sphaeroforma arctica JP610]KNC83403.1 hypothetical protein SARC_04344 [Sphaeroforma arctica JP610]|eukprot:XP_014157305.1 hypothetical protein SARC_04344 [Sphaeroforma arctica JP610]